MTIDRLASRDNQILKRIRLIASGARRAPSDVVVAEGVRVLEEALKARCAFEMMVISERFGADEREARLIDCCLNGDVRVYRTSELLFRSISSVQTPQGAVALVRVAPASLESVPCGANPLIMYACGIQDPGNLGTLVRTAVAAKVAFLCTSEGTVSARNPKSVRSSAGTFFHLPVIEKVAFSEFSRYCSDRSIEPFRTDPSKGIIYSEADLTAPCAILLGNEGSGMGAEYDGCRALRIPLSDQAESLNVAVAGAVLLFEACRQRRFSSKDSL